MIYNLSNYYDGHLLSSDVKCGCSPDQSFCWEEFTGNTMTQYSPTGQLLFLHTNLSPKWNLMVPGDFKAYTRRCAKFLEHLEIATATCTAARSRMSHDAYLLWKCAGGRF